MLSYAIVNALSRLILQPISNKLMGLDTKKEEMMLRQIETKHTLDLEVARLNRELDFDNQFRLQEISHRNRLEEATEQINLQYQMWINQQTDSRTWPLNTPFGSPLLRIEPYDYHIVPLTIFMAKSNNNSDFVKNGLESTVLGCLDSYLTQFYISDDHPINAHINDWKGGRQYSSDIQTLWQTLKGQPCLIVTPMPTESNKSLELNITMWGLGSNTQNQPTSEMVLKWDYLSETRRALRNKTKSYIEINEKYNSLNPNLKGAIASNIEAYKEEREWRAKGASEREIEQYILKKYTPCIEFQDDVFTEMGKHIANTICCVAGLFADIYFLLEYGSTPIMPTSISDYSASRGYKWTTPGFERDYYRKALTNVTITGCYHNSVPEIYAKTAKTLCYDASLSKEILREGVWLWANKRNRTIDHAPKSIRECVMMIKNNISYDDMDFLKAIKDAIGSLGEDSALLALDSISIFPPKKEHKPTTPPPFDPKHKRETTTSSGSNDKKETGKGTSEVPKQGQYKCRYCGATIEEDAAFCIHCGKELIPQIRKCSHCGGTNDMDSVFCMHCGRKL